MTDTFTYHKNTVLELCEKIRARAPGTRWVCNSRVDTIDGERLHAMKAAGCEVISYGVESEYDVSRYLNLMVVFGDDFDTDPAHPWASDILTLEGGCGGTVRMDALYEEAAHHWPEESDDV